MTILFFIFIKKLIYKLKVYFKLKNVLKYFYSIFKIK